MLFIKNFLHRDEFDDAAILFEVVGLKMRAACACAWEEQANETRKPRGRSSRAMEWVN